MFSYEIFVGHISCSWDSPNGKNISFVFGCLVERGQILLQAEFVHKIRACPHAVKPILERNKRPDFLFSIVFLSEVAERTGHTANKAKRTVPTLFRHTSHLLHQCFLSSLDSCDNQTEPSSGDIGSFIFMKLPPPHKSQNPMDAL